MLEATAEWYSRQLSENVTRGMTDNAMKCLYNGTRILGYVRGSDGRYAISPDDAAVVRNIFDLYSSGCSAVRICAKLNAHGITTSRGKRWQPESVLRVISNERYTGVYIWGDIRIPDGMPAIIDRETFERRIKVWTIEEISCDNDLGENEVEGYKLLDWLEATCRNYPIRIHSANPVARERMRAIIERNGWTEVR